MTNSIITQDGDVVNYANVVRIAVFTVSNSEDTSEEAVEKIIKWLENGMKSIFRMPE